MVNKEQESAVDYLVNELKNIKSECGNKTLKIEVKGDLLKRVKEIEQQQKDEKINKAINEFERLKKESKSLRDAIYLDGVLAVLDGVKNEKM
jgi:hypothetical protein